MKSIKILLSITLIILAAKVCLAQVNVITYDKLEQIITDDHDTLNVINFWATWCAPCVEELPYFETMQAKYPQIKIHLVSLDFKSQLEKKLIPFIQKKQLRSNVYLLDEPKYNSWIDKISKDWQGSLPATLFVNGKQSIYDFHEQQFSEQELENFIIRHLNP